MSDDKLERENEKMINEGKHSQLNLNIKIGGLVVVVVVVVVISSLIIR